MDTTTPDHSPADAARDAEPGKIRSERLRRPDPKRSAPIRDVSGYFRHSQSWGEEEHPAWREPSDVLDDVITQGVRLGYSVIDEHLRQGRLAAARIRAGDEGTGDGGDEIEELLERVQRVYKDVGSLCFDALDVIARSPVLLRWLSRKESAARNVSDNDVDDTGRETSCAVRSGSGAAIAIEMASTRRTRVTLNLPPQPDACVPAVHALYAGDPSFPPLTQVEFRIEPATSAPILTVGIPDDQPAALYSGVVVDRESNEPKGTLSVRIFP